VVIIPALFLAFSCFSLAGKIESGDILLLSFRSGLRCFSVIVDQDSRVEHFAASINRLQYLQIRWKRSKQRHKKIGETIIDMWR
jgi:hypothetical protein